MELRQRSNGYWYKVEGRGANRTWTSLKTKERGEALVRFNRKDSAPVFPLDMEAFLRHAEKEYKPKTYKTYRSILMASLSRGATWEERIKSIQADPFLREKTKRSYVSHLRTIQNFNRGTLKPRAKAQKKVRQPVREYDLPRLLQHCHRDLALATEFAFYSGCRRDEVANLLWEDVLDHAIVIRDAKTGYDQEVEYTAPVRRIIEEAREASNSPSVFGFRDTERLTGEEETVEAMRCGARLGDAFSCAKGAAGFGKEIDFHSLRAGFATWLDRLGLTPYQIAQLGRWKDVASVKAYISVDRREAARTLNALLQAAS